MNSVNTKPMVRCRQGQVYGRLGGMPPFLLKSWHSALTGLAAGLWFHPRAGRIPCLGRMATLPLPGRNLAPHRAHVERKDPAMTRFGAFAALFAIPTLLLLGAPRAAASTQATITIIMTTLGTDGSTVSSSTTLPEGSSVTVSANPVPCTTGPANPPVPIPTVPAPSVPSGGTGNPIDNTNTPPDTSTGPSDPATPTGPVNSTPEEPVVPPPPVVIPPQTNNPGPIDSPVDTVEPPIDPPVESTTGGNPAETPEPATITLAVIGAIGAATWSRRKKKIA